MKDRITRADVAINAGVSESTVSRALSNSSQISEAIKEKVRDVAGNLGYIPNRQAALLAKNKTFRLGLVVRTYKSFTPFSRSYFPRLLDGTLQRAEERGFSITIILDSVDDVPKDLSLPVRSKEVDGLLFSVTPMDDPRYRDLKARDIPFVLVNNRREGYFCVDCDAETGMREAFNHITTLGHRRIAYIAGDPIYWDGKMRLEIFTRLADEYGITATVVPGNFSMTRGREAAGELLERRDPPTLIMCASDRSALGVLSYCRDRGIKIPGNLSLIGFDNLGPARDAVPGLTTINQPISLMGGEATDMLIDILENRSPEPVRSLKTDFIIRESTGRPLRYVAASERSKRNAENSNDRSR